MFPVKFQVEATAVYITVVNQNIGTSTQSINFHGEIRQIPFSFKKKPYGEFRTQFLPRIYRILPNYHTCSYKRTVKQLVVFKLQPVYFYLL